MNFLNLVVSDTHTLFSAVDKTLFKLAFPSNQKFL